jgi:divalent metal cation (Fe/Co/Zn/Cd) transporter
LDHEEEEVDCEYPVGRRRVETMGVIMFCALMTIVAVELIIESAKALAAGKTVT